MDEPTRATGYDLFKLIVAILLLILFLLLFRRQTPQAVAPTAFSPAEFVTPASSATPRADTTDTPGTFLLSSLTVTIEPIEPSTVTRNVGATPTSIVNPAIEATLTPLPAPTISMPTDTLPSPSATNKGEPSPTPLSPPTATRPGAFTETPLPAPTATQSVEPSTSQTPFPSLTATNDAAPTATLQPTATLMPVTEQTPSPIADTPFVQTVCEAATSRSRLQTNTNAQILRRLNFRSSPGIRDNWLRTNLPGTRVEVIGGPECVPHSFGAYVWWQIRLPDGQIGWSAEGSILGTFYFMELLE